MEQAPPFFQAMSTQKKPASRRKVAKYASIHEHNILS